MSIRPTPCAPAIVSSELISSVRGIATPLTLIGTPRSNSTSTQAGASGAPAGDFVSA